jgi:hypothetical protein
MFDRLTYFVKREDHCRVTRRHITESGANHLENWVSKQRQKKEKLSEEKIKLLDSIGFVWNPRKKGQFDVGRCSLNYP